MFQGGEAGDGAKRCKKNPKGTTNQCSRVEKLEMEPRGKENPKGTNQSFDYLQFGKCYCPKTS